MIPSVSIEDAIKKSLLVQQSKADVVRVANILDKTENGENPIFDTLDFVADKVSDKKRNAIIAVAAFIASAVAYKKVANKAVPYAKKAVKWAIDLFPKATGDKITNGIKKVINKELKDVKLVNKLSGVLSKVGVNKIGDVALWGGAGLAAAYTSKGANIVGDKIDDEVDLKQMAEA